MIRSKDVNVEVSVVEDKIKTGKVGISDIAKLIAVAVKLLRDIRRNQVLDLNARGVKLETIDEESKK